MSTNSKIDVQSLSVKLILVPNFEIFFRIKNKELKS